jgi:hypothetical protein
MEDTRNKSMRWCLTLMQSNMHLVHISERLYSGVSQTAYTSTLVRLSALHHFEFKHTPTHSTL